MVSEPMPPGSQRSCNHLYHEDISWRRNACGCIKFCLISIHCHRKNIDYFLWFLAEDLQNVTKE